MTRLILHVGPAKCGSTSIQQFFSSQKKPCTQNVRFIVLNPLEISELNYEKPSKSILTTTTLLLENGLIGCDVLILSHEYLFQCPYAIKNICDLAKNLVTTTYIIGYSRKQSDFLLSAYSQWSFREPDLVKDSIEILDNLGLDSVLFSGLERQLIAGIVNDFYNPELGTYRIFDWHSSYKSVLKLVDKSGAIIKGGVLPNKQSGNSLIQDFCEKSDLTLRDAMEEASWQIFNISFHQDITEAINSGVVFGLDMPGPHESNEILELLSSKMVQTANNSPEFLSSLKSYIDTYFSSSNHEFCQEYGLDETYFAPMEQYSKPEILNIIIQENQQRALNKSIIINNNRMLAARLVELCLKLGRVEIENDILSGVIAKGRNRVEIENDILSSVVAKGRNRTVILFRRVQLILVPPNSLRYKVVRRLMKIFHKRGIASDLHLIRSSNLFDSAWYLSNNPDVADAGVDPLTHYLQHGGFEGRDPGPDFSSSSYLDTNTDVREARINPLVHYLRYGQGEGRLPQPSQNGTAASPYKCPVCQAQVNEFLPLPAYYIENLQKYGFPYTRDEGETINFEQYSCPNCGANDRDRLYACYLNERIPEYPADEKVLLLEIAPSHSLNLVFQKHKQIYRHTADLLMESVDLNVDITNMPEINSDTYDILICSHVLEHVDDDKKALSELYRVLKPGGWGIIMVPIVLTPEQIDEDPSVTDVAERWRRFGQGDHVRLYNKRGFIERVENAGFTLHQLGIDYFGEAVFEQYGITRTSVLYIAEKTNKATFTDRILNLIEEASYYEFSKTEESFVEPRWENTVNVEPSRLKRRNIQKVAFEKLNNDYDLNGLESTYNILSDEYSKEMLLRVIVGRVMGPSRCRFPLYYSHIWRYFDKIDELLISDTCTKVGMWDFYLYKLEQIGFDLKLYSSKIGVFINFLLEQYKYKNFVFVKEGDYVIDGGACYGDTALYFAALVKDKGKVFSFEFIKNNLEYFHKNIELNPDKKNIIELIEKPLWSNSETEFSAIESGSGSRLSTDKNDENARLYKTISIDDFVAQNRIEKIDFIKLDIEGAELDTLKGSVKTIKKHKPQLAICVYHKNSDFWEIPRFLNELDPDYEFFLDHFVTTPLYETVLFARIKNSKAAEQ